MRRNALVALGVAAVLAVSACAGDGTVVDTSTPGDSVDSTTAPVDSVPSTVDGFTAPLVGGGQFSLVDALNSKPVALWFWAPG